MLSTGVPAGAGGGLLERTEGALIAGGAASRMNDRTSNVPVTRQLISVVSKTSNWYQSVVADLAAGGVEVSTGGYRTTRHRRRGSR